MRTLFDVNVLLALFDPDHIHHERAHRWWKANRSEGWSSCPLTENGFIRVMSQPSYPKPISATAAVGLLRAAIGERGHVFWSNDLSVTDERRFDAKRILGPKQVTDIYLLALAVRNRGRLATFDRAIPVAAVHGAQSRHVVVPA